MKKKKNYLNNKDMLMEIHKSKLSFCEYSDPDYGWCDYIAGPIDMIHGLVTASECAKNGWDPSLATPGVLEYGEFVLTDEIVAEAKQRRAARIADLAYRKAMDESESTPRPKLSAYKFDPETIHRNELIFRVVTFEHIPLEPGRKKNPKTVADHHTKLNFIPFKHYVLTLDEDDDTPIDSIKGPQPLREVLRSHSYQGEFSDTAGTITDKLARMYMLMVNRYSQRSNWRGYTYLDEMKGQALLQLSHMGLQFNEAKSDNPFSYYTASVTNSFTRVLNIEKKNQDLRDDLLIQAGQSPSFTRQLNLEEEIRKMRETAGQE